MLKHLPSLLVIVQGLKEILKASRRETGEVEAELTRVDIIKCIQSERVRFRGVNLSGIDLSKLVIFLNLRFLYL